MGAPGSPEHTAGCTPFQEMPIPPDSYGYLTRTQLPEVPLLHRANEQKQGHTDKLNLPKSNTVVRRSQRNNSLCFKPGAKGKSKRFSCLGNRDNQSRVTPHPEGLGRIGHTRTQALSRRPLCLHYLAN